MTAPLSPSPEGAAPRLAEIQARLDAATQGVWSRGRDCTIVATRLDGSGANTGQAIMVSHDGGTRGNEFDANADLVANAPGDLAFLLALLASQSSEIAELRQDKARLDWLIARYEPVTFGQPPYGEFGGLCLSASIGFGVELYIAADHRAAIDAARASGTTQEKQDDNSL